MAWGGSSTSKTDENDAFKDIKNEARKAGEDVKDGFSKASEHTENAYEHAKGQAQEHLSNINDYLTSNGKHVGSTYNHGPRKSIHEQEKDLQRLKSKKDSFVKTIQDKLDVLGRTIDNNWPTALSPNCLGRHVGHVHGPKTCMALQLGVEPNSLEYVRADLEGRVHRALSLGGTLAINKDQQITFKALKANVHLFSLVNSKAACSDLDLYVGTRICEAGVGTHKLYEQASATPHVGLRYNLHRNGGLFVEYDTQKLIAGFIFQG